MSLAKTCKDKFYYHIFARRYVDLILKHRVAQPSSVYFFILPKLKEHVKETLVTYQVNPSQQLPVNDYFPKLA